MAAFDPIKSGIKGLDNILDSIRLGDNVVFRISKMEEFSFFAKAFVRQAIKDKRKLLYIRFAEHEPILEPQEGLEICELDTGCGFEEFTVAVREIITNAGRDAFYVFDCLSELQTAWATDLMMGNFFYLTCPYLFELDTVAFFPLKRGCHSFDAVNRIRQTTQLFSDVYQNEEFLYIHPLKVWNRYSGTMFQPHCYQSDTEEFIQLSDGMSLSKYYIAVEEEDESEDQNFDYWDRYFSEMKLNFAKGMLEEKEYHKMCNIMMTKNPRMADLILENFEPRDYFQVRNRMIGTGMIGGKSCGMLLARKMVSKHLPQFMNKLEPHDSYYVGSDVFYTYIVANDCWQLRVLQRKEREEFTVSEAFRQQLKKGAFPENIRAQFRRMLDYFGQSPIIVRSSSLLEDDFDNAFAGKYESVFCVNSGEMEERLQKFEEAVKIVYASMMDPSALEYRRNRKLLKYDEQMALLVQRVSGSRYDSFLMPSAAGVGYSYNAYKWLPEMEPEAGMLRLVMGLGTRAVDRTAGDYPRLVSLDRPQAQVWPSVAARHRYSQHQVDVMDFSSNALRTIPLEEALAQIPTWMKPMLLSHDTEAESRLRERGDIRQVLFADCQGMVNQTEFLDMMKQILALLQNLYQNPVDIEFAVNVDSNRNFLVNLLQCRPLKVDLGTSVSMPLSTKEKAVFEIQGTSMGQSRVDKIEIVVMVDPQKYYTFPHNRKYEPVQIIRELNHRYGDLKQSMMLIVPGRIGTSSPELGVPVVYADISMFSAVCEVSYSQAGYMPELSYGSHMFQDLVEASIFYGAIFEDERTKYYQPELLANYEKEEYLDGMIKVYDLSEKESTLYFDMLKEQALFEL